MGALGALRALGPMGYDGGQEKIGIFEMDIGSHRIDIGRRAPSAPRTPKFGHRMVMRFFSFSNPTKNNPTGGLAADPVRSN
jgi:hypothetical protein